MLSPVAEVAPEIQGGAFAGGVAPNTIAPNSPAGWLAAGVAGAANTVSLNSLAEGFAVGDAQNTAAPGYPCEEFVADVALIFRGGAFAVGGAPNTAAPDPPCEEFVAEAAPKFRGGAFADGVALNAIVPNPPAVGFADGIASDPHTASLLPLAGGFAVGIAPNAPDFPGGGFVAAVGPRGSPQLCPRPERPRPTY